MGLIVFLATFFAWLTGYALWFSHFLGYWGWLPKLPKANGIAVTASCGGRGHLTQMMSLVRKLESEGHCVTLFITNAGCFIPDYALDFLKGRGIAIRQYPSAELLAAGGKVDYWETSKRFLSQLPSITRHFTEIHRDLIAFKIGHVFNLYDTAFSLYYLAIRPELDVTALATQLKSRLVYPAKYQTPFKADLWREFLFQITVSGAAVAPRCLAISPLRPLEVKKAIPPLIEKVERSPVSSGRRILAYILFPEYKPYIVELANLNPSLEIDLFLEQEAETEITTPNLTSHRLSYTKFHSMMETCDLVVTTAGIETACEAILRGKYVVMVPSVGHYEQETNAHLFASNLFNVRMMTTFGQTAALNTAIEDLLASSHCHDDEYEDIRSWYQSHVSLLPA